MNTLRKLLTDPENRRALPLFIAGSILGVANYYVKPALETSVDRVSRFAIRKMGFTMPEIDFDALDAIIAEEGAKL